MARPNFNAAGGERRGNVVQVEISHKESLALFTLGTMGEKRSSGSYAFGLAMAKGRNSSSISPLIAPSGP